jgi:uncharacterized protein YwlG (UPF0340 family)
MGESRSDVGKGVCHIHGETIFISGENQGGYDGMSVCLKCCAELNKVLTLDFEKNDSLILEELDVTNFWKKYGEK